MSDQHKSVTVTLIFGGYLILVIFAVKAKSTKIKVRQYVILCTA